MVIYPGFWYSSGDSFLVSMVYLEGLFDGLFRLPREEFCSRWSEAESGCEGGSVVSLFIDASDIFSVPFCGGDDIS